MSEQGEKTIQAMLYEYNQLVPQALALGCVYRERKSFKDRNDAIKSLTMINSSLRAAKAGLKREDEVSPGLQRLRDSVQGETIRQQVLADQQTAAAEAAGQQEKVVEVMARTKKEKAEAAPRRGRQSLFKDDMKISVQTEGNPKREGSRGYQCFAHYREGMKVSTFIEKVGDRGEAIANLRYDVAKGYIAVA